MAAGHTDPLEAAPRRLTVASLNDSFLSFAEEALRQVNGIHCQVEVEGVIGGLGDKKGSRHYFEVTLSDLKAGGSIFCTVPIDLAEARNVVAGSYVRVIGRPQATLFRGTAQFRLLVVDFIEAEAAAEMKEAEKSTLESMKRLFNGDRSFPKQLPISLTVIGPAGASAKGGLDFLKIIGRRESVQVRQIEAKMNDLDSVAEAIRSASSQVVAVVRGGGDTRDFAVFDSLPVIEAFAHFPGYRIVGLGHEGDRSLAEMFVEHAAITPSAAAQHLIDKIDEVEKAGTLALQANGAANLSGQLRERAVAAETKLTETEARASAAEIALRQLSAKVHFDWKGLLLAGGIGLAIGYFLQ